MRCQNTGETLQKVEGVDWCKGSDAVTAVLMQLTSTVHTLSWGQGGYQGHWGRRGARDITRHGIVDM